MANWLMIGSETDKTDTLINLNHVIKMVKENSEYFSVHFISGGVINVKGDAASRLWEIMKQATVGNSPSVKF